MRIPYTICRLRLQFGDSAYSLRIPLTLADSATAHFNCTYLLLFVCGFQKLARIPQTLLWIPKIRLALEGSWAKRCFRLLLAEFKTLKKAIENLRIIAEKIITMLRILQRKGFLLVADQVYNALNAQFGKQNADSVHNLRVISIWLYTCFIPQTVLWILQICRVLEQFWPRHCFWNLFVESKTAKKIIEKRCGAAKKIIAMLRSPRQIWLWPVAVSAYSSLNAQFGRVMLAFCVCEVFNLQKKCNCFRKYLSTKTF